MFNVYWRVRATPLTGSLAGDMQDRVGCGRLLSSTPDGVLRRKDHKFDLSPLCLWGFRRS